LVKLRIDVGVVSEAFAKDGAHFRKWRGITPNCFGLLRGWICSRQTRGNENSPIAWRKRSGMNLNSCILRKDALETVEGSSLFGLEGE
jgi:hypothetical protein